MSHITTALFVDDLAVLAIIGPPEYREDAAQLTVGHETWGNNFVAYTRAYATAADCRRIALAWSAIADQIDQLPTREAPL